MRAEDDFERIRAVIRRIPRGCVATYGQVAREAGFPKRPRLTGQVLGKTPNSAKLPWFRVINAQGKISLPPKSPGYREQKKRLEAEGVVVLKGKIDLERYKWKPRSDAPVID